MKWAILVVLDYNISGARVLDFFLYCIYFQDRVFTQRYGLGARGLGALRHGVALSGTIEWRCLQLPKIFARRSTISAAAAGDVNVDVQVLLYFKMLQAANCRFDFLKIYLKYVQTCVCGIHIHTLARLFRIINIFKYLLLLALPH